MVKKFFRHIIHRYDSINGPLLATGLCFSLIVGLLPLLFIAVAVGAYLINLTPELRTVIVDGLANIIPPQILENYINRLFEYSSNWQSLSAFTIFIFLLFSLNLFNALGRVLRTILSRKRSTVTRHNLISLFLLSVSLLLFYVSTVIGSQAGMLGDMTSAIMPFGQDISFWMGRLLNLISVTVILMILYYIYSNKNIDFFPTLAIASLCSFIWVAISLLGSTIIQSMISRFLIFGTMATPVIFLVYLRIFAEILIFSSLAVDFFSTRMSKRKDGSAVDASADLHKTEKGNGHPH